MTSFCKDCRHAIIEGTDVGNAKCDAIPKYKQGDDYLVTGIESPTTYFYCSTMRSTGNLCGPEGKLFEAKA